MDQIQLIPMEKVIPTRDNPRVIRDNDPKTKELAESIKSRGLLQPVLCRPHPTADGCFDLRAGERRYRAHQMLGRSEILAIVRDMDDDTALDVTITENLQRENLAPMEEARGVKSLLDSGRTPAMVAGEIGKSVQWVVRRAKLADLHPAIVTALESGNDGIAGTSIAHLELIARFDHDTQKEIIRTIATVNDWMMLPRHYKQFEEAVSAMTRLLNKAPFATDDATLSPADGACNQCQRRSSVIPGLFDDELDPQKLAALDKCLSPDCWQRKAAAHDLRVETEIRAKHPNLVKVASAPIPYGMREQMKGVLGPDAYQKCAKSQAGALPALVVDGEQTGKLIWVNPLTKPASGKQYGQSTQKTDTPGRKPASSKAALKARTEALNLRRKAWVCTMVSDRLAGTVKHPIPLPVLGVIPTHEIIIRAAAEFGTGERKTWANDTDWKQFEERGFEIAMKRLWDSVVDVIVQRMRVRTPRDADAHYQEALRIAKLCRLCEDESELMAKASAAIPTPKSLQKDTPSA